MKICVVGVGAIGGYLAVRLAASGHAITVIARGAHLSAIRARGLTLVRRDDSTETARVRATDRFDEAGHQDLVILGVKAHQIAPIAEAIPLLFHDTTTLLTLQNGIPWWYFHREGGEFEGHKLRSVDPGEAISRHVDADRIIHSVVYPAAELVEPGVIHHHEGDRFPLGEPSNQLTQRVQLVSQALTDAGLRAPVLTDLRGEIWLKLIGNVALNPISALTHAGVAAVCRYALTRELMKILMTEAKSVAERLGVTLRLPIERRIEGAEKLGAHKMSTLQDLEAGRELEIDAMLGAVAELGDMTGVPTPSIKSLYACTKLLEKSYLDAGAAVRLDALR
jgi:2-dehydropantoate 2-reductase